MVAMLLGRHGFTYVDRQQQHVNTGTFAKVISKRAPLRNLHLQSLTQRQCLQLQVEVSPALFGGKH